MTPEERTVRDQEMIDLYRHYTVLADQMLRAGAPQHYLWEYPAATMGLIVLDISTKDIRERLDRLDKDAARNEGFLAKEHEEIRRLEERISKLESLPL
jgi:hypothetical protein